MAAKLHLLSIMMLLLLLSPLVLAAFDDRQKEKQSEQLQQRREPAAARLRPHLSSLSYLRSTDAVVARRDDKNNNNNHFEDDVIESESTITTTTDQRLLAKTKSSSSSASSSSKKSKKKRIKIPPPPHYRMMNVTVTNLSFRQPFGSLFVMIYDRNRDIDDALGIEEPSLFRLGRPASPELRELAEHDDPSHLVTMSKQYQQVYGAFTVHHQHLAGGQSVTFQVPDSAAISPDDHKREAKRYITIAGMLQNTNDGFVAVNGVHYHHRSSLFAPAYDAGTEENNEDCASILGPACTSSVMDGNVDSGNGEGFVHIHRGISGRGTTLTIDEHDWKNPIMEITFMLI